MAEYVVSGAGNWRVNGLYVDRGNDVNGKPCYTNEHGYFLLFAEEVFMGERTWIIAIYDYPWVMDFIIESVYYKMPFWEDTPDGGTWYTGDPMSGADPPAPTIALVKEPQPEEPDPFDPTPEPDAEEFPEPELYTDELDPTEPAPTVPTDMLASAEMVWVITRRAPSGSSTLDVWRSGAPFVPAKYIDTRDFSAWRAGSPFIRWIDDLPPQVSRNPALRKVRTFRHGPKIVVIGG